MKRPLYITVLSLLTVFSSCEQAELLETEGVVADKVVVTASIGNETKTYLEQKSSTVFKTRWSEGDSFDVIDVNLNLQGAQESDIEGHYGYLEIAEGVGNSSASFVLEYGDLPKNYYAIYRNPAANVETGHIMAWIDNFQSATSSDCPMAGIGTGNSVRFQNLCGFIKLNIAGNGESLQAIEIASQDEGVYIAGHARLDFSAARPTIEFNEQDLEQDFLLYDVIDFDPCSGEEKVILSSRPKEFYIVVPPQTYPSGLKITLTSNRGQMELLTEGNLEIKASELREIPAFEFTSDDDYAEMQDSWILDEINLISGLETDYRMSLSGDYLVCKDVYVDGNSLLAFYNETSQTGYGCETNCSMSNTNAGIRLKECSDVLSRNIIGRPGWYDIYLDPSQMIAFIMNSGWSPYDLPTTDFVLQSTYESFKALSEGDLAMVSGMVMAQNGNGYIVALNGKRGENVYLYDKQGMIGASVGNWVDVYGTIKLYRGLNELVVDPVSSWCHWSEYENPDYVFDEPLRTDLYNADFSSYECVSLVGTLTIATGGSGNKQYSVTVHSGSGYAANISSPHMDLSSYANQKVYLEGYYLGSYVDDSGYITYRNIMMSTISLAGASNPPAADLPLSGQYDLTYCSLELAGPSVARGEADSSSWNWGNVALADGGGSPEVDGNTYTWTWTGVEFYSDGDARSAFGMEPGLVVRTVGARSTLNTPCFYYYINTSMLSTGRFIFKLSITMTQSGVVIGAELSEESNGDTK